MNVPLLLDIKAHILAEPDAFRMDVWSCGTAHCIGGWACMLSGVPMKERYSGSGHWQAIGEPTSSVAERLLGLDDDSSINLFEVGCWPDEFSERYQATDDRVEHVKIAAERIDHFIATNGAE